MNDETFRRFALCVSDRYNRVGFAVLCDLASGILVFRNTRTRAMHERVSLAIGESSIDVSPAPAGTAAEYHGREFSRLFRLTDEEARELLPLIRENDYTEFKRRCASYVPTRDLSWLCQNENDPQICFEGYAGKDAPPLRIDDYRGCGIPLLPFDKLRRFLMDRFDLWRLPGADPGEKTPRGKTS